MGNVYKSQWGTYGAPFTANKPQHIVMKTTVSTVTFDEKQIRVAIVGAGLVSSPLRTR
jgi:hypothetical protein